MPGFLEDKIGEYANALKSFRKALEKSESLHAFCKLAEAEAMLYLTMPKLDPRRSGHTGKAMEA